MNKHTHVSLLQLPPARVNYCHSVILRTKDLALLMKLQTTTDMNLLNPATISKSGGKESVAEEHQMDS